MNKIVAIVVTHNRLEMLKKCIEALLDQSPPCDVLVVNNASTDGTEKYILEISRIYKNVSYHNTGKNLGGAGGFHIGIKLAVEAGYDYVWIMDDDCLPYEDALSELMIADEKLAGKYGWLSSVALWSDGHECKMNRQKLKNSFCDDIEFIQYDLVQAEQATFVSLFLKTDVIRKVGLPIKDFFIWGDDTEYTRRISVRYNMPCFVVGKSKVHHAMKSNTGSSIAIDGNDRIERYRYAFRNENYLYRQEGIKGIVYYIAKCGINILRILKNAPNRKLYRCSIILDCMIKGIFFNPEVEYINSSDNIMQI